MSEIEVKALEWSAEANGEYVAVSVIGWFHIGRPASYWNLTTPHGGVSSHETLESAKDAAQSDYEARIRSALVERKAEPIDDCCGKPVDMGCPEGGSAWVCCREAYPKRSALTAKGTAQ